MSEREATKQSTLETPNETNHLKRRLIRVGAFALGAGILASPLAAMHALQDARVYDDFGVVPATLEFSPGGSSVSLGPLGSLYNDKSQFGMGIHATVEGPPSASKDITSLVSPSTLSTYAGMFHDPKKAVEGYQDVLTSDLRHEFIKSELRLALEIGVLTLALSSIRLKDENRRKQLTAAVMGGTLLATSGAAALNYHEWKASHRQPQTTYSLPSLDNTALAGTTAEYNLTATLVERAAPAVQLRVERESAANDAFIENSTQSLLEHADLLAAPRDGEAAFLLDSDMHSNKAATAMSDKLVRLMNERYGDGTIDFVGLPGDLTYGSAVEKSMVDDIGKIGGKIPKVAIRGNHDSDITKKQMQAAGINVLHGETKTIAGVSVLGDDDARLTPLFGANVMRGHTTPAAAAAKIYKTAQNDKPTLLMEHEAYDLEPILDIGPISKSVMSDWFHATTNHTQFENDNVKNIPASLVAYGHWHRDGGQRVVWNDDGSWSVVAELSTAGGAIGTPALTNFTTPWSPPGQDAIQTIFYSNMKSHLITGMQKVMFHPDGTVTIEPRLEIGSPDGQPFPVASNSDSASSTKSNTQTESQTKQTVPHQKKPLMD